MQSNQEDRIISEFLQSLGPWREFVVIGGGYALFIYKLYLTDEPLENPPIGTRDIDSLIPRRIPEIDKPNIAKHLNDAGFRKIFKDMSIPASESYVKQIEDIEIEVEFLTDTSTRVDKNKNVIIAGVVAQPLNYLTLSLKMTTEFQTYSNEKGRVVSPGAWMFHKGLTFTKRRSTLKVLKDLYGIWYVSSQLGDFSHQAITEFYDLAENNSKWFETLQKNLRLWIENATPSVWSTLEMQDPSGKLKKLTFERMIERLLMPLASIGDHNG